MQSFDFFCFIPLFAAVWQHHRRLFRHRRIPDPSGSPLAYPGLFLPGLRPRSHRPGTDSGSVLALFKGPLPMVSLPHFHPLSADRRGIPSVLRAVFLLLRETPVRIPLCWFGFTATLLAIRCRGHWTGLAKGLTVFAAYHLLFGGVFLMICATSSVSFP